jgi:hypothetical protein
MYSTALLRYIQFTSALLLYAVGQRYNNSTLLDLCNVKDIIALNFYVGVITVKKRGHQVLRIVSCWLHMYRTEYHVAEP